MAEPGGMKAFRVEFNLREMFPADDPLSIPLLRLMAATNDARYLLGTIIAANANVERGTEFDRMIRAGEFCYLLRMLGAHLYEAGIAFRELHDKCRKSIEALLAPDDRSQARSALKAVEDIFNDRSENGFDRLVLQPIRNLWAFHYKAERFREALNGTRDDETELIACENHTLGRYTCVDDLVSGYSLDRICDSFGGVEVVVQRLRGLITQLCIVVDTIVAAAFEEKAKNGSRMDTTDGTVTIPPAMTDARTQATLDETQRRREGENGT
jgi:hypothetical protein